VTALPAFIALPVTAAVILLLLRSPAARLLMKVPQGDRWRMVATPIVGGTGIFAGIVVALAVAAANGGFEPSRELVGIVGGLTIVFLAGLYDDLRNLQPAAKIAAQLAAAGVVVATGTSVDFVGNDVVATAFALFWLVAVTNAFNMLDNVDGLAATIAAIAAGFFALDAYFVHSWVPQHVEILALSVAVVLACAGFLPFNLRLGRRASVYMGDSGSQVLGFALGSLGLAATWQVAGTTVATLLLPILVLGVPILDTALVTVLRLLEGRPVARGARDHSSHRLIRYGLSEWNAVFLLGGVAALLGATSLAYGVLENRRITLLGALVTFVVLVQFASFLSDLERRPAAADGEPVRLLDAFDVHWRRLVEVVVDFGLISGVFLVSYVIAFGGLGSQNQRHLFYVVLPVLIAARYIAFILLGLYRSVWRYAATRDLVAIAAAVLLSEAAAVAYLTTSQERGDFALRIFALDALLCIGVIAASRFAERAILRARRPFGTATARRTVIVGAGRAGRSLHRELRETTGERMVGFLDDNARLRRRRVQGASVHGTLAEVGAVLADTGADRVLVTIPDAPRERLELVLAACRRASVECRFVRREIYAEPDAVVAATAE
jgi:UDP-GlcNAc:undecaprenyl-phosphate/decaprenyl-phosphate GlcNAc-1-phosphate transferase